MKPLSTYISEGLDEYYHFTNLENILNILKDDFLAGSREVCDGDYSKPMFISLTRSKNSGTGYPHGMIDGKVVRIVLDGRKLTSRYKISPYDYFGNRKGKGTKTTVMYTSWEYPSQFNLDNDYIRRTPDVEAEDRLFLRPGVDGVKGICSYIKEIQVSDRDFGPMDKMKLLAACKKRRVKLVMMNPNDFELGIIRKK